MALNYTRVQRQSEAVIEVSGDVTRLLAKINRLLEHNGDLAIDWGAAQTPGYISESVDGNMEGFNCTRQNIANSLFSLDQVRRALTNQSVTQGDHLGNLNITSDPLS